MPGASRRAVSSDAVALDFVNLTGGSWAARSRGTGRVAPNAVGAPPRVVSCNEDAEAAKANVECAHAK